MPKYQIIDKGTGKVEKVVEALQIKYAMGVADIAREKRRKFIVALASSNVLLIDSKEGWGADYMDPELIPPEARKINYCGKQLYLILVNRDDAEHDGCLEAFVRPEEIKATPQKLRRVFEVKKLIDKAMRPKSEKWEKLRAGLMVLLIILFIVGLLMLQGNG